MYETNGATYKHGKPVLLDHNGRPFPENFRNDGSAQVGGISLPHSFTLLARYSGADNTYLHSRYDEALRHGRQDAEVMRRDAYLMALLQERQLAVSGLNWHLEVPDDKDPYQARVRDGMTRIVAGIPSLRRIIHWLTEATWYGRYGVQLDWDWSTFMDRPGKKEIKSQGQIQAAMAGGQGAPEKEDRPRGRPRRCLTVGQAWPVNGDKIGYQYDHTPYVLVSPDVQPLLPRGTDLITTTIGGMGLRLRDGWREKFLIHEHLVEDVDFFDGEQADAIHGVGIRSKLFWLNWLKLEWLSNVTDFFDRVGLGMTLWRYPAGNDAAKREALQAAQSQSGRAHILTPVWGSDGKEALTGVDRVEVPTAGSEALIKLIEYVDRQIERYVVGQQGSSRPGPSGIGNEAASEFMMNTKTQITKHDASMLAVTLTGTKRKPGLLNTIQKWTFPEADFPVRWAFDVEKTHNEGTLNTIKTLVEMGLDVKADEARSSAGLSKPAEGDEVIKAQVPGAMQPGAGPIPGPGMGGAPGAPGAPGGDPGATAQQQQPLAAPEGDPGDFLSALQMAKRGSPLRYDWSNMGVVKVSPSGLPLFRWYDPAIRQARIQHVKPGEGRRKGRSPRGKGPGRTATAQLDAGPKMRRLLQRLLKLMFPGGWVRPSGLPALIGAGNGGSVTPWPRRDKDGAVVIELHAEGEEGHWELVLHPGGRVAMDPPGEPNETAVEALAIAGVDVCGKERLPEDGIQASIKRGNRRRRKYRAANAADLMDLADEVLPRPKEEAPDESEAQLRHGRLGEVLRALRLRGRHREAAELATTYSRREAERA